MEQVLTPLQGFCGTLDRVEIGDLIQSLCLAQVSHTIGLHSNTAQGTVYLNSGQIVHAETEELQGEEAFYDIFRWKGGSFEAVLNEEQQAGSINKPWEYLLIEALRLRGEKEGGEASREASAATGFSGSISQLKLVDLVQLVCMVRSDYLVAVESEQGSGQIHVRGGQVCHASIDAVLGEDAFFEMLLWKGGRFAAGLLEDLETTSINKPWEYLLIEGMRVLDERAEQEGGDDKSDSMLQKLQRMKVVEKIRLAMTGDKEVRNLLIRDANRMVQFAVISNPRITESEVTAIAHSRHSYEEVLRKIANNREWIKLYPVKLALAKNPKTPLPIATKLVPALQTRDLKQIAKSKGVPVAVALAARRMITHT